MSSYFVMFDDKHGRAVPDARAKQYVIDRLAEWSSGKKDQHVTDIIGTCTMLACYKWAIAAGHIDAEEVVIIYEEDTHAYQTIMVDLLNITITQPQEQ